MNISELKLVTKKFVISVNKILYKYEDGHIWLCGIGRMVLSYMNMDNILEDMNLFHKYVKKGEVLDFGAGSGYNAILLEKMGFRVKGVDVNNYVEYEKNNYNRQFAQDQKKLWAELSKNSNKLSFTHYKDTLPYRDNVFDAVLAYAVLEHVPPKKVPYVLAELHRVLKPKGTLYITRLPRKYSWTEFVAKKIGLGCHEKLYGDQEMTKILVKSKFRVIEKQFEEILPAYPESITNRLYPLLKNLNKLLLYTPLKYFSHHLRIVCLASK